MEERDQEFWNNYVKEYDYNPNFIKEVPIEFQTQEMWNHYAKDEVLEIFGIRNYVPEKFQTRAMWEKFYSFKSPDFVKKVPEKFQTTKMWERYLEKNNYFYSNVREVPLCYQTQDMWDKSMKELGYNPHFVQEVPKKFISLEILRNVVENKPNHKQYDFYFFEKKLAEMEKQEKDRKEIEKSYITNQERDYETGSRTVPYGEDENYSEVIVKTTKKHPVAKRPKPYVAPERDYETGSRADFDIENDYGMEL